MNTLSVLYCSIDWQPIINAIPCICWGIIALVALLFLLKYIVSPLIANYHELKVKKVNNAHEESLVYKKGIKEAALKQKDNDLEIEKLKTNLAQKRLEVYEDFYDKLEFDVRLKDNSNKEQSGKSKSNNTQQKGESKDKKTTNK